MRKKEEVIAYRLKKSSTDLEAAHALVTIENWSGAVNRLHYATFHAVCEWSKFYSRLVESRNDSDYEDFAVFTADDVLPLVPQTEAFISLIKGLIQEN